MAGSVNGFDEVPDEMADDVSLSGFRGVGSKNWRDQNSGSDFDDADWNDWARQQAAERNNAAHAESIRAGQEVWNGFMQLRDQVMSEQRQRTSRGAQYLLSGFKLAAMNGGVTPHYALAGMGDALGYDGKNKSLVGAVINDHDGSYSLVVQDANGGVEFKPFKIPQIYNIGRENPGVLTRDEMLGLRENYARRKRLTPDMANRDLPMVSDDYGRIPVGEKTPTGGTSVNPHWLFPQQRARISAFGANGRGGFTRYYSGEETGHQLVSQDFGTRAPDYKGRWKAVFRDNGTQTTRYENDKTGEVATVRDGDTPPWERGVGGTADKERLARMNNESRERIQKERGQAQRDVAQMTSEATMHKADQNVEAAKQKNRSKGAVGTSGVRDSGTSLRSIVTKNSGATDEQRQQAINGMLADAEDARKRRSETGADRALNEADDIIKLYGGNMNDFTNEEREQIRKYVAGEVRDGNERSPDEWDEYFRDFRAQKASAAKNQQSKDNPVPAPNNQPEVTHNGKKYKWGWSEKLGKWKYIPQS